MVFYLFIHHVAYSISYAPEIIPRPRWLVVVAVVAYR